MLADFIRANRDSLLALCAERAERRSAGMHSALARKFGTAQFLGPLILALETSGGGATRTPRADAAEELAELAAVDAIAARHGMEMLSDGVPVDWVIHEYGDLCQAITQLAQRRKARIPTREFEALNWCLDNAMASAVSEYAHQRELLAVRENSEAMHESLGRLADELRVPLSSALQAAAAMRAHGGGAADSLALQRNLDALREVIDRSLAEIRLESGMTACPESIAMADLISDLELWAQIETVAKGCRLEISPVGEQLAVYADRALLFGALKQLLGTAFRPASRSAAISMRVLASDSRVFVEIEEPGTSAADTLGRRTSFEDLRNASRGETDPARALAKRGLEQAGGRLRVRDLAGGGRLSSVDLPRLRLAIVC